MNAISLFIFIISMSFTASALDLKVDINKLGITKNANNHLNITNSKFSDYEQKALAKKFIRQIRATGKVSNTPELTAYIQELGAQISHDNNITFLVLNDEQINAFATLGEVIVINTGLILATATEGELSGVIAHEVAHVSQHHIERIIAVSSDGASASLQALLIAAAIVSAGTNPAITQAAIFSAVALPVQKLITYTRLHEAEADAIGLQLLTTAGYDSQQMINMFKKLMKAGKFNSKPPEFLLTHPLNQSRIAMLQNLSNEKTITNKSTNNDDDYRTIKAILKLVHNYEFTEKDLKYPAAKLAYAIRLLKSNAKSQKLALAAIAESTNTSIYFKLLAGQYFMVNQQIVTAIDWYQQAYQQQPKNMAAIVRFSESLLRNKQPELAYKILTTALKDFANEQIIYRLIAKYYLIKNNLAKSYYWRAEAEFLSGHTKISIQQLMLAKKSPKVNFYLSAKIDAKIKEYQAQL